MIDINHTPLYKAMKAYSDSKPIPFHMPGHKLGKGMPEGALRDVALWDLTEIPGTDNLHFPEGAIKEAQQLAAQAFGAEESFFLVNGSTVGVLSSILSTCKPGDKVIISRDCHKSVIHGILLAGAVPVYIKPGFCREFGIPTGALTEAVEVALVENPDAVGVFITRPNYYGVCCDIHAIVHKVHSHGKILIVDEAHGAHFKFGSELPVSAMDAGADICIQSAHKTLPALTQTAYLHVKGKRVDVERLKFYLRMLQTSSPSYLLMASLDIAREIMVSTGRERMDLLLESVKWLRNMLEESAGLSVLSRADVKGMDFDSTRVVVNVKNIGKTGFFVEKILRQRYNIQVEMADLYNIVCISTIADERRDLEKLGKALREIAYNFKEPVPLADIYVRELAIPPQKVDIRQILNCKTRRIRLKEAEGKTSSSMVTPYPPGIPVICPGEIIMADTIEYVYNSSKAGGVINGLTENMEIDIVD